MREVQVEPRPPPHSPSGPHIAAGCLVIRLITTSGEYRYFKLEVEARSDFSLSLSMTGGIGEADLYVTTAPLPSAEQYDWSAASRGDDTMTVHTTDAGFCAPCTYWVAVRGVTAAQFSLVSSSGPGDTTLMPGQLLSHRVAAAEYRYYRVMQRPASLGDLRLVLEPCSGRPDLYASHTHARPSTIDYDMRDVKDQIAESIEISAAKLAQV